ncbi:thiamine phosphate synthase [Methylobacterium sp. J-078]|uniref:thiamine phosphate synthase n=1 Tax=Methylobacterium sp. J-078 TaxID=2836657 RepID=UPI001FBB69BA|nr:thiamine phosphate synthase [Methylobacterium sp. J-078]MCJ2047819.1 thiamine phosphate synthase [Methylobacterium sp. J-078]
MSGLPAPLLAVTERPSDDGKGSGEALLRTLDGLLGAGIRWVWFRERDLAFEPRRALGRAVAERVRAHRGTLTVGGDPALAASLGADGVHLPGGATATEIEHARHLLPKGLLGVSAHGIDEVQAAAAAGADYVTLSPIFPTASKPGYGPALGPVCLRRAASFGCPVIALGGITEDRVADCMRAGAAGIAVMGTLMRSPDPASETRRYLARLEAASRRVE